MSEQDTKREKIAKMPYERPLLKQVELKTDEVLAANCSNSTSLDPLNAATCGTAGDACSQTG